MSERVVVTGMGALTPLGLSLDSSWAAMLEGKSGAAPITRFDTAPFQTKIACEVKGFEPSLYIDRKELRRMDRYTHYAIAAAKMAIADSGVEVTKDNADDIGVIVGSGVGGIETLSAQFKVLYEKGPDRISPFLCTMMISNIAAGQVAIQLGIRGPNYAIVSACASGAHAIGEAYETIRRGSTKMMLAGGAEAPIVQIGIGSFNQMGALSTRNDPPESASRPFDVDRDGFVLGEGGGILVLESLTSAKERGARIYAEIVGYAATADACHVVVPAEGGAGASLAMTRALESAFLSPESVDYINAHGTSTVLNDRAETEAIKTSFGKHAYKLAISSTKSMTGHLLGAAGAVELMVCILAMRDDIIPPTINLEKPAPECDLDYVPHKARKAKVNVALSNSLGFGGHNASLIVKRFDG